MTLVWPRSRMLIVIAGCVLSLAKAQSGAHQSILDTLREETPSGVQGSPDAALVGVLTNNFNPLGVDANGPMLVSFLQDSTAAVSVTANANVLKGRDFKPGDVVELVGHMEK